MDCELLYVLLAFVGVYALITRIVLPFYRMITSMRLHPAVNWSTLGAKKDGWALITGASTGMGREYALQLARKGMNVVIIADPPTQKELEEVRGQVISESRGERRVIALSVDLLDDEVYESTIFPALASILPNISILVNNVGMCVMNRYTGTPIELDTKMMSLNVIPMVRMTKHILPHMKAAKRGAIVNMASLSGDIPTPFLAVYGATKTFVRKFNDSIREEVRNYNISVTVPMPFGVLTPLYAKIGEHTPPEDRRDQLSILPSSAVASIIRKMASNMEHYGHDMHEVMGYLLSAVPRDTMAEGFGKALIKGLPKDKTEKYL